MSKKNRLNALASLANEMSNEIRPPLNKENAITSTDELNSRIIKEKVSLKKQRRGVSNIPWYPKSAKLKKELKLLALHEDSSLTALIDEGIRLVLKKRGKNMDDYI